MATQDSGRICAVAGQSQREMSAWAATYPNLFAAKAFDAATISTLALATAFSGPWLDAGQQRMANRVTMWCFGLDWLIDYVAASPRAARAVARRCLAVAEGGPPTDDDELELALADIHAELRAAPGYAELGQVWQDELRRMLAAMVRECEWKASGRLPTLDDYLANADNLGLSFVFAAHWTFTQERPGQVAAVRAASWAVQRVIRLVNDLGTYDRDLSWGDLNALMLGVDREQVRDRIAVLAEEARVLMAPVRAHQPRLAEYLERQMEFCVGFYGVTDYWGSL